MPLVNFGRNVHLTPSQRYAPRTEEELLAILERHRGQPVRVVGRLHSWSRVLECEGVLLDLRHFDQVETLESSAQGPAVRVGAGCQIKRLLRELRRQRGWTLPSVGFITEQSVAGAISTGTHGSGRHSLSHYVTAVRVARYREEDGLPVIDEIRGGAALLAARCSLGCLGVIVSVEMQCRRAYRVEECFREFTALEDVLEAERRYPLQQFYLVPWKWTFVAQHRRESERNGSLLSGLYHAYRFLVFDLAMHLLILLLVRGLRRGWRLRRALIQRTYRWLIPRFVIRGWTVTADSASQLVMEHELFRHIELELFVRRDDLPAAVDTLRLALERAGRHQLAEDLVAQGSGLHPRVASYCHHYPICIRKILPDETLISMASPGHATEGGASDQAWYSITLTSYSRGSDRAAFERLAADLTREMASRYQARPHWGKLCTLSEQSLRALYPHFSEFQRVCRDLDPQQRFSNRWTSGLLQAGPDET